MTAGKQNLKTRVYGKQTNKQKQTINFHPEIFWGPVQ